MSENHGSPVSVSISGVALRLFHIEPDEAQASCLAVQTGANFNEEAMV